LLYLLKGLGRLNVLWLLGLLNLLQLLHYVAA
jgi:hypothetical protein